MTPAQMKALKPGDRVAYETSKRWHVTTVERVLATQIATTDRRRWKMKNGGEFGAPKGFGYHRSYLREATPERIKAAAEADEHETLVRKLSGLNWKARDLTTLRRVMLAVEGPVLTDDERGVVERTLAAAGPVGASTIIAKLRGEPAS